MKAIELYARLLLMKTPEAKFSLSEHADMVHYMGGICAVNLTEPSPGDLKRLSDSYHVLFRRCYKALRENDELRADLEVWNSVSEYSGCTAQEVYGQAFKLKKGVYGPRAKEDLPCCDPNVPMNRKIHDDLCDHLADKGYNEADVCTASVGIWATIKVCSDLFSNERTALRARLEVAKEALKLIASQHTKDTDDMTYWQTIDHDTVAEMLARDTRIARQALAQLEAQGG